MHFDPGFKRRQAASSPSSDRPFPVGFLDRFTRRFGEGLLRCRLRFLSENSVAFRGGEGPEYYWKI